MAPSTLFFLHVPKTAGRYVVTTALKHEVLRGPFLPTRAPYTGNDVGRLHYGGHNVVRRHPESPVRYFTHCVQWAPGWADSVRFTVVRNPFDLLVSMYTASWPYGGDLCPHRFPSFEHFLNAYCDPGRPWLIPDQKQNLFFQLFEEDGTCPLDAILHHEHIDDELALLCRPLGIQPVRGRPYGPSRWDAQRDHRTWYTDRLREMVEKKCAFELAWTGYDFEGLREAVRAA